MQIVEETVYMIVLPDRRMMTLNEGGKPDAEAVCVGLHNEQTTPLAGFLSNEFCDS